MRGVQISSEQYRILEAASREALVSNQHGRWTIAGERRPDRREREKLQRRGMLDYGVMDSVRFDWSKLLPTERGREAMLWFETRAGAER